MKLSSTKKISQQQNSFLPMGQDSPKIKLEIYQKNLSDKQIILGHKLDNVKYAKKSLKSSWISYLALKENKTREAIQKQSPILNKLLSIRNLEDNILLQETEYLNPSNQNSINLYEGKEEDITPSLKEIFDDITKEVSSLIKLEKEVLEISKDILSIPSKDILNERITNDLSQKALLPSQFIENCHSAPESIKALVKQYKKMTCIGKIFRPIFFSLPQNIRDYISTKNIINPLENKEVKKALQNLDRTSKICRIIQLVTWSSFPIFVIITSLLKIHPFVWKVLFASILVIPLAFPFAITLIMLDATTFNLKGIMRVDEPVFLILLMSVSFLFLLSFDIQRSSYRKNLDILVGESKQKID